MTHKKARQPAPTDNEQRRSFLSPVGLRLLAGLLIVVVTATAIWFFVVRRPEAYPNQPDANATKVNAAYVDNRQCVECHQKESQDWTGSDHEQAMQLATADTMPEDFGNSVFTNYGVTSRFFKKDGKFFVNTEAGDGSLADFEIKYTFGVRPLQQYLIEFPGGRMQALGAAWDPNKKQWFHLYPDEKIRHDDPLHWTRLYQNWNLMCADCHSTNLKKNYDP
ncbi:MAG: hypothetical protein ND895_15740, partial [Pyrinomonadaceae bacterium]|nr:hypothetical protein [Pyrinomonadaceae bacterium]